jgi:hypothetical protein
MPAHNARTSRPHADLTTNNSSRGRTGRNTNAGAAAGIAAAGLLVAVPAAAAPPPTALTAFWQPADSFDLFFSRQLSAAGPPVGTLAQFLW